MVGSYSFLISIIILLTASEGDPAYEMYRQATLGDVDFITGDYLAGESSLPILVLFISCLLTSIQK